MNNTKESNFLSDERNREVMRKITELNFEKIDNAEYSKLLLSLSWNLVQSQENP